MKKLILALPLVAAGFACQDRDGIDENVEERARAAETFPNDDYDTNEIDVDVDADAPASPGAYGVDGAIMTEPGDATMPDGAIDESGAFQNDTTTPEAAQPTSPPSYD